MEDEIYMKRALALADEAAVRDEVPVGALIVQGDRIVAEAYNTREGSKCATHHAEILAIEQACRVLGGWRLPECTLYVTLEPCPMCAVAILAARVGRVVYAAKDPVAGAMGSVLNLPRFPLGAHPKVEGGLLLEDAREMLQAFFKSKR